jgi:ComF family protein
LIIAKSWSDHVASKHLADLIWERTDLRSHAFDYLVPVPLHWTRLAKRGFNQSDEIAKVLARCSGKKLAHVVKRTKKTIFQAGLNPEQRHANVAQSFSLVNRDLTLYKGKHLVIVDDLLTTGATVRAVAHLLLQLKPASICVVVASRVTQ